MSTARWTYLGERDGASTKRVAVWRTDTGERVAWKASPKTRGVVGYVYEVTNFDGSAWPGVTWTNTPADDLLNIRLENDAVTAAWSRESAIRKAKQRSELAGLDAAVDEAVKGLSWDAREALIAHLRRRVHQAP